MASHARAKADTQPNGGDTASPRARSGPFRLALVLCMASAAAGGAETAAERARDILRREGCQTELPLVSGAAPGAVGSVSGADADLPLPQIALPTLAGLAPAVTTVLLVGAVAVALAVLLAGLRRGENDGPLAEAARKGSANAKRRILPDHDRLAQAGRFGEAIHALLLRALADLERLPGREDTAAAAPSRTSREVLQSDALAPALRSALSPLVASVEATYFGTAVAGLDEYRSCLERYRGFEAACRGRV